MTYKGLDTTCNPPTCEIAYEGLEETCTFTHVIMCLILSDADSVPETSPYYFLAK